MFDTNCEKCGEWIAEYGQGPSHKCKSKNLIWPKGFICLVCGKNSAAKEEDINHTCASAFAPYEGGHIKFKEKSLGEKAEEIAECVAISENLEEDLDRILDSTPTNPIMKNFNQAFSEMLFKQRSK